MHKIRNLIALTLFPLLLLITVQTRAQTNVPGSGLSISPVLSDFEINTGQADKLDITLKNITGGDILAQASVNDFTSDNQTGNPRIITDTTTKSPYSIRDFVVDLEDVRLTKGEQKKVTLSLQIPAKTPPGAYYGIIRYKATPAENNNTQPGQVALTASVGTIVLITVPGDLKEQIQLSNIFVYAKGSSGSFLTSKPNEAGIEVKNLGNGFAQPFGTVDITDTFGNKVHSYQMNNTSPRATVLPNSSRVFKNKIQGVDRPGRYTVTASVAYGSGSVLVAKKTFWYIPAWLAVLVLVALAILVAVTYRSFKQRGAKRRLSRR